MKRNRVSALLVGAVALLGLVACSDDVDELNGTENSTSQSIVYKLNVEGTNGSENTRALTLDEDNRIHTAWKPGDKMFVYNCSDNNKSIETQYSTVVTKNGGGFGASFAGAIKSKNIMQTSDVLGFFYPGAAIEQQDNVAAGEYKREAIDGKIGQYVKYYDKSATIKNHVLLNLSEQDGTLETIDKKYDYCWGKTSPTDISGNETSGYSCRAKVNLHRIVAFWGIKFKDANGNILTDILQVSINGLKSTDVLSLKDGNLVGDVQNKDFSIDISNAGQPISLTKGYIWIVLLPEEVNQISIMLKTKDGKVYSKSVSKDFEENVTYRSTITQMQEVTAKPYVTVCGTKWATGNFIRYTDPNDARKVYWGVAPAQWWISHYADNPKQQNNIIDGDKTVQINYDGEGSQNWYIKKNQGEWCITANDLDLFTWGSITNVLNFDNSDYLRNASRELTKTWWPDDKLIHSPTTVKSQANYGDIVWYYTEDQQHNHHYRFATKDELKGLMKANTIVPGYCYTDKGNRVYGAYFSDATITNIKELNATYGFPTSKNSKWKFENVTGLVLANKGLFLPITGRRANNLRNVQYRYMNQGSTFQGQYSSSQETAATTMTALVFGSNEWIYGAPQKQQGLAIRPVYDSGDEKAPVDACKFAAFRNILTEKGSRKY